MKKLELSKSNVDGMYILISTPNDLPFLSVEILFSIAIFQTFLRFIFILKKKKNESSLQETYFFNQGVLFLSLEKKYCLHTKMTSFVCFLSLSFFLHISNFKVRDFAILDCCPDDKNHKQFSLCRIYE